MIHALIFIKGCLFGIANIIPGVSGGTFALILGIYERLIGSISAFGIQTVRAVLALVSPPSGKTRGQVVAEEIRRTDAVFLLLLLLGAAAAILASSRVISHLLDEHRAPTLAFFVGLIVPSIFIPYRLLKRRGWREALACLAGAGGLVSLTAFFEPVESGSAGLIMLFVSGLIAISAMILPGISGSFMLMVLGEYKTVLDAINEWDFVKLGVFGIGCVLGLLAFVRLIQFLLKRFHSVTMAFLMGLILGSLWALWPFKEVAPGAKIITGTNVLPGAFTSEVAWSVGALAMGFLCSLGLFLLGRTKEQATSSLEEPPP